MGLVTVIAVFGYVTVLEKKWSLLVHMAASAGLLGGEALQQFILLRAMHFVAISTNDLFIPYGMVGRKQILRLDFRMTAVTEISHFFAGHFLRWALVQAMTVGAGDIVQCVRTGVPMGKNR